MDFKSHKIKELNIIDVKPGMILAEEVRSPKGQIIAEKDSMLTAQQLLHMTFYAIGSLKVYEVEPKQLEVILDEQAPDDFIGETQSWRITNSPEFKEFVKAYEDCADKLENVITNFVETRALVHDDSLVEDIRNVFTRHSTGLGIMAMLLNVQGIDTSTYAHSVNVAIISRVFGGWLGITDPTELDVLTMAGLYHDIGKSLIPNEILEKPGPLTDEEFTRMTEHPMLGYYILGNAGLDKRIKLACLQHHERGDGSGYPYGSTKEFIEDYSMIVAIADVYDAMTADRCYRAGICPFEVIAQFQREPAEKYRPDFLSVFLDRIAEAYIGAGVLLSDNTRGVISMINKDDLSSPLVKIDDDSFVDLSKRRDLYIKAVI